MTEQRLREIVREELATFMAEHRISADQFQQFGPHLAETIGQKAIRLAKQGQIEESRALLREASKRRAA